jgi:hypothetical protein
MMIPTQIRIIRLMLPCLVAIGAFLGASPVTTQTALVLENKIPLGDIRGRLDHMAVDLGGSGCLSPNLRITPWRWSISTRGKLRM